MANPRFFYGWVIVGLCAVSLGLAYSVWYSFTVFFLAVIQEFGWSRGDTALAFAVFVMGHGVSGPLMGVLVARLGLRRVMPLGALFLAASLALCSVVTARWQYYLTFGVLASFGVSAVGTVPNYAALNRWFVKRRGFVIGVASAGIGAIGISLLVPVNQYLISTIGWRHTYLVLAAIIALVLAPLAFFLQRERPQDIGLLPDGLKAVAPPIKGPAGDPSLDHVVSAERRSADADWTARRAVRTRRFWVASGAFFLMSVSTQTVFVHEAAYLVDLGHSQFLAAAVISLVGTVSIFTKIGWGVVSDRLGRELSYTLGCCCLVGSLILLLALPVLRDQWVLYIFAILFANGYGAQATLTPAITGDLFPGKHYPVIYGVAAIFLNAGSAGGPWLAGYLFDVGGSYAPAFYFSIAATVTACAGIWIVAPRRIRPVGTRLARTTAH